MAGQPTSVDMQVEDNKKALLLHGGKVSQVVQVRFLQRTKESHGWCSCPQNMP